MQVDSAVVLGFALRNLIRCEPAGVVERLAVRQPGDRRVAGAVDRPVHQFTGGDVDDPQPRFLGASLGKQVGQQRAVGGGLVSVERGQPRRVECAGVDEHPRVRAPRGAVVPGRRTGVRGRALARPEHGVFPAGFVPQEERAVPAPRGGAGVSGIGEFCEPDTEGLAPRFVQPALASGREEPVLLLGPGSCPRIVHILEPAVRIGDPVPV